VFVERNLRSHISELKKKKFLFEKGVSVHFPSNPYPPRSALPPFGSMVNR